MSSSLRWFEDNKGRFAVELNGYKVSPVEAYLSTLSLINKPGILVDLGCGNGMLMKFIDIYSKYDLKFVGVEIEESKLEAARSYGLGDNFKFELSDVREFVKDHVEEFDVVITNPYYHENPREYVLNILKTMRSGGRLIFRVHSDVLSRNLSLNENKELLSLGMVVSYGVGLEFGVIDKK